MIADCGLQILQEEWEARLTVESGRDEAEDEAVCDSSDSIG